ncbi:MAG: hypothetical protein Q8P67_24940 [archaeon]|nr:hypothetical protein [archaeon]
MLILWEIDGVHRGENPAVFAARRDWPKRNVNGWMEALHPMIVRFASAECRNREFFGVGHSTNQQNNQKRDEKTEKQQLRCCF